MIRLCVLDDRVVTKVHPRGLGFAPSIKAVSKFGNFEKGSTAVMVPSTVCFVNLVQTERRLPHSQLLHRVLQG